MYNIHPTDFLIFCFDREVPQSKVLFQCPQGCILSFFQELVLILIVKPKKGFRKLSCLQKPFQSYEETNKVYSLIPTRILFQHTV